MVGLKRKTDKRHIAVLYIETVLLIVVTLIMVMILSRLFWMAKMRSAQANKLSNAVYLAENAAEAFSAAENVEMLCDLLDEAGNVCVFPQEEMTLIEANYASDRKPDAKGALHVQITWQPLETITGTFVKSNITVKDEEEVVFTMQTAVFQKKRG